MTGLADGAPVSVTVPGEGSVTTGLAQATGTKRPLWRGGANGIGGQPAFQFDGTDDNLQTVAQISNATTGTWIIVHHPTTGTANRQPLHTTTQELYWDDSGWGVYVPFSSISTATSVQLVPQVWTGVVNGAASSLRLNGSVVVSGTLPTPAQTATTLTLGSHATNPSVYPGKIAEVIGWNRALTAAELADAHSYVQDTYGITVADYVPSTVAVAASRATTWAVRARVPASRAAAWVASSAVATSRGTSWNVAATGTVGATRAAGWSVLARSTGSRATAWTVRTPTSASRATGWAVLTVTPTSQGVVTPGMRLRVYLPNGADQGNLPTPESGNVAYPLNDLGALAFSYSARAPRAALLGQPCELAVEVTPDGGFTWLEPPNSRFVYVADGADPIDPENKYSVQARAYVWRLTKAWIHSSNLLNAEGKRAFLSKNVGTILKTLINEAQARGALTGIVHSSFTSSLDSAGQSWGTTLTKYYEPGLDLMAVLQDFADSGLCDYRMQGRSLYIYNPDTALAQDRSGSVVLRAGRDLKDAPFTRTWEALADSAYFLGDGVEYTYTNPSAATPWGRQEVFISNGSVSDPGTMAVLTQAELSHRDVERVEHTRSLDFTRATSRPFFEYNVGDYVGSAVDGQVPAKLRVRQLTLQVDQHAIMSGNVVLNDRFLERDVREKRRVDGITNGAQSGPGTGTPPVVNPGVDTLAPAQVSGLAGSSSAYMGPGGFPQAQVSLTWAAVTTNADGTPASDIDHYEIFRRLMGEAPSLAKYTDQTTDTSWDNSPYVVGSNWVFNVCAVDNTGHRGARSADCTVGMAQDTVPPQAPSAPVVTARLGIVSVFWDGLPATGTWPLDFDHIEVHVSTVNNFTPTSATLRDVLYAKGASIVTGWTYGTPLYAKLIAVDKTPLKSAASAQGTATPSRLVGSDISADAITYEQLGFKDAGNLVVDGSLESEVYRADLAARSAPEWAFSTADKFHGNWSATINAASGAGTVRSLVMMDNAADPQQIRAGEKLFCRMAYKGSAGANGILQLVVTWFLADGTASLYGVQGTVKNGTWQQVAEQVVAPANVVSFRLYVQVTSTATTGTYWVDAVEVRRTIGTAIIEDAAIKNAQIDNLAVNSAKIADLDVGKLTAGTLSADVLVAGRLMTATSGNRVEMTSTGIRMFRGSTVTGHWDPTVGQMRFSPTGGSDVSHTSSTHPLQVGANNSANLAIDNNEIMARFNGSYGTLQLNREGGSIVLGGKVGGYAVNGSDLGVFPHDDDHRLFIRAAVHISDVSDGGYADEWPPFMIGNRAATHLWMDNNEIGAANADSPSILILQPPRDDGTNHTVGVHMASASIDIHRISDVQAGIFCPDADVALQFNNGGVNSRNPGLTAYRDFGAAAFTVVSEAAVKRDVQDIPNPLAIVRGAKSRQWKYRDEIETSGRLKFGPMLEDLPAEMRRPVGDHHGYDVASLLGILWAAVGQLAEERT